MVCFLSWTGVSLVLMRGGVLWEKQTNTHGGVSRDQPGSHKHCGELSQSLAFLEGWTSCCLLVITRCTQLLGRLRCQVAAPPSPFPSPPPALLGCPCHHLFFRLLLAMVGRQTKPGYFVAPFLFSPWNN